MKKLAIPIVASALTAIGSVWGYQKVQENYNTPNNALSAGVNTTNTGLHFANNSGSNAGQPVDFTNAAENTVKSVVHIKIKKAGKVITAPVWDPFADFFGGGGRRMQQYQQPDVEGGGSGVIISNDGYILTNNHVVAGADEVMVTFDTRSTLTAKVVGTDPETDLAVIKIEAGNLPAITFGNSDEVKLGQWVLAVGYPLNLDATVTAGIVSAKGRSIGINRRQANRPVESFIQTDAAINPGNSGGALVNTQGQLVGINSAIASPTGTYAGYGYAIPSNLARKVADDIIKFGSVKRGYLGVSFYALDNLTEAQAKEMGINSSDFNSGEGVYIGEVLKGSGAEKGGLKKGDRVVAINGLATNSNAVLTEQIARYHPGDKVQLDYIRGGKTFTTHVELKDEKSAGEMVASNGVAIKGIGATVKPLTQKEANDLGVEGGLKVVSVTEGPFKGVGVKPGFIIMSVNGDQVNTVQDLNTALANGKSMAQVGGNYSGNKGGQYFFSFPYSGKSGKDVE